MTHPDTSNGPDLDHRRATAVVTVRGADGSPLADQDVVVQQTQHRLLFGNIGFDLIPLANDEDQESAQRRRVFGGAARSDLQHLADLWLGLFNQATLPFYWGGFEPAPGRPDTDRLLRAARWFTDRDVVVKGHPLVWHTLTAPWLADLPIRAVEQAQRERIRREVSEFAGVIDTWDAINEVVIMPVFDKETNGITRMCRDLGRIPTIRLAFEEARAANPTATLLLNDFDLSTAYECLIEGVLEAGIQVDALGLQSHMHQGYWGEEKTLAILDRFARYGLPIHFTETTLLSGDLMPGHIEDLNDHQVDHWPSTPDGEARQADEVVRHYRTLVSHPAVEAITYWGLTDDGAWLGAPGGLVRADGTPKPAYDALRGLLRDAWWLPPTQQRTDGLGRLHVAGFLGRYQVDAGDLRGDLELTEPGVVEVETRLRRQQGSAP